MANKGQSDTSRLAYDKIYNGRDNHYKKLVLAMEWLNEGTSYQLSRQAGLRDEQGWKRISELVKPDENGVSVFIDTGKRGLSPQGNPAIIYAMYTDKEKYAHIKPSERFDANTPTAVDYASKLSATAENNQKEKEKIISGRLTQK